MRASRGVRSIVVAFASGLAAAQAGPPEYLQTYPFCASKAVASEAAVSAYDDLMFAGLGGGIVILRGGAPEPWTGTPENHLRVGGFTRHIRVTDDHLWVAAGSGGLVRYDRNDDYAEDIAFDEVSDAWTLDVVEGIGGDTYVFVGTYDPGDMGKVYAVRVPSQIPIIPVIENTWTLGSPVFAVEASTSIEPGFITLLVGTACNCSLSCESLLRYDIDISQPQPAFPANPSDTWSANGEPTFIRDVVFHEDAVPPRAYVATMAFGTFAFELDGLQLDAITTGWPIAVEAGSPVPNHALALHEDLGLLVVALATPFGAEVQQFGTCSTPSPCGAGTVHHDGSGLQPGLRVYDNLEGTPVLVGCLGLDARGPPPVPDPLPKPPVSVSIRPRFEDYFQIDVACDIGGFQTVSATRTGQGACGSGAWYLDHDGDWDEDDGVPASSMDDVVINDGVLYAANEIGLWTYDVSGPVAEQLDDVDAFETSKWAILLAAADGDGFPARLYAPGLLAGTVFYDIDGANALTPVVSQTPLMTGGRPYESFPITGLASCEGGPERWLYIVNTEDTAFGGCDPPGQNTGSVHVYRVNGELEPDPLLTTPRLGVYGPSDCPGLLPPMSEHGYFLGVYVTPADGGHAVLVSYGPRNEETTCGLLVLHATYNDALCQVEFSFVRKVVFRMDPLSTQIGRLTYDAARGLLYAAYACSGIAMYDISDPLDPLEVGRYEFSSADGEAVALQVTPAPDNHVFVTLLSPGIGIVDATDATSFGQGFIAGTPHRTRFQANAIVRAPVQDPAYEDGATIFLADGRGGVHRMVFQEWVIP